MDKLNESVLSTYPIPEDLVALLPQYLERRDIDVNDLKTALRESNYELIYRIGHNMKGNGSSYGFDRLSEIGEDLVNGCKTQNLRLLTDATNALEKELIEIKSTLFLEH